MRLKTHCARARAASAPDGEWARADGSAIPSADVATLRSIEAAQTLACHQLAYRAAFLKCHATLEFACATLNHHGGAYPRRVIAAEWVRCGVELRLPSVLRGLAGCELEREHGRAGIRVGLGLVKSVRSQTRRRLLDWHHGAGRRPSFEQLLAELALVPRELEALLWSGACDGLAGLGSGDYPRVHQALLRELSRGGGAALPETIREARCRLPRKPPQLVARYAGLFRVQQELRYLGMHVPVIPCACCARRPSGSRA